MTDEERLRAIHHETCVNRDASAALARIRAILDDAPSVEWQTADGGHLATHNDCDVYVFPDADLAVAWTCEILRDDCLVLRAAYNASTLASAKARAIALYVALKVVT